MPDTAPNRYYFHSYLRCMTRMQLIEQIRLKRSYLCVGLDTDISKIPRHLLSLQDPVFEFNKQIIDATKDYCVSYKINTAFYESRGIKGWESMERTVNYIPATHLTIADAKRGDIGNTSAQYAKAFFDTLNFDAITVAPYMGGDSIRPFLEYKNKWTIVLGLTSNPGAKDFELQHTGNEKLYEKVLRTVAGWGSPENLMFVIGATRAEEFINIRNILPHHFLLVPGVGFQGGSLKDIAEKAMNKDYGILVNVSRAIIFAGEKEDFATEATAIAAQYQKEMSTYIP
ncbi:MAG TPA: orotidine-5'-phosphate decarboxylase [Agriterribacter sp.]|nr:orotidine-5'-phosphate decarboxylase [Agriterribacter sp.]HRQ49644.1 orotidine-5'-phosphate decarboxylase [Agriterribacter sp.]